MNEEFNSCRNIEGLNGAEVEFIEKHIDHHKYLRGIESKEDGVLDFIEKYHWVLREMYCGRICELRFKCSVGKKYLPSLGGLSHKFEVY